ncbi:uncharacterized protein LOC116146017 [Pistacia vera]|uniref:uncharacterized protein LOC116146017 n=1 Tax=Pistacia vera TaxID=55513 RepID=UPI001263A9D8|nr:uncharacterized protein LOC116146017 [Pistacia vera]
MGFTFAIQYYPGASNRVADALSRREYGTELANLTALSMVQFSKYEDMASEAQTNPKLRVILQDLLLDSSSQPNYQLRRSCLFYKNMLVILKGFRFVSTLLVEFHQSLSGGHSGFFRTYKRVSSVVY